MKHLKTYEKFNEMINENDLFNIIPDSIKELNNLFKKNNKKLFLVGGAVRDFINGEKPKDFDLTTDANPDEILNMLGNKYKVNLQGKQFGVIVVYTHDQKEGIEIATFREDLYNDKLGISRNPDIEFSTIEGDVKRRDITYNALFYDIDKKEIVDLVGGIDDMKNKVTKFIGDPNLRIEEDPLRILRILRFTTRYNYNIDEETEIAILKHKDKLNIISKERIFDEFTKAFKQSSNFSNYLELINRFDMWHQIFPGVNINKEFKNSDDVSIVLAVLFINNDSIDLKNKMIHSFRIDLNTTKKVCFLINLYKLKIDDVYKLYQTKNNITNEFIDKFIKLMNINDVVITNFTKFTPSVKSEDLMKIGFKGKSLGDEINRLEVKKYKNEYDK